MLFDGIAVIGLFIVLIIALRCIIVKAQIINNEKMFICIFNLIVFVFAISISGQIHFVKDEITLTALHQVGSQSKSDEVFVTGIQVDGKEYEVSDVVEGMWYYSGSAYIWKNIEKHPELKDITDSVTIRVPVGLSRQIMFSTGTYRGLVYVLDLGREYVVDTSISDALILGRSSYRFILLNEILRALVVGAVMLFSIVISLLLVKRLKKNVNRLYHFIALPTCAIVFIFMWYNADMYSFWIDELYQIAYVSGSLWDTLNISLNSISDPPIYNTIAWIWYQIFPHTDKFLLLLPELCTLIAMYLLGYFATVNKNVQTGCITLAVAVGTELLYVQCAFENRQYALWFLASVLLLQAHHCFIKEKNKKTIVLYALALVLSVLTQYLSVALCLTIFICDLILWYQKKETPKVLVPYFLGGGIASPFAIVLLLNYLNRMNESGSSFLQFWPTVPELNSILELIFYLISENTLMLILLFFGAAHIIMKCIRKEAEWQEWILLEIPIVVILLNYFYSTMINRAGSLWVDRYFILILPQIILLCADGLECLIYSVVSDKKQIRTAILGVSLVLILQCGSDVLNSTARAPYREAANWLYDQMKTIYKDTTLVLDCEDSRPTQAWYKHYLTQEGKRADINCVSYTEIDAETLLAYDKIFLVNLHRSFSLSDELKNVLNSEYKVSETKSDYRITVYDRKK